MSAIVQRFYTYSANGQFEAKRANSQNRTSGSRRSVPGSGASSPALSNVLFINAAVATLRLTTIPYSLELIFDK